MKKLLVVLICMLFVLSTSVVFAESFKVGYVTRTMSSPYYVNLSDALMKLCEEEGWTYKVLDAAEDVQKETEAIESFVTEKYDLIFLDCVDPTSGAANVDIAFEAKIPVIELDSGLDSPNNAVTTVYSDNKQNGRLCGLYYAEYFNKKKSADEPIISILLSGDMGNVAGKERSSGLFCGIIEGRTGMSEEEAWVAANELHDAIIANGSGANEAAKFEVRGQNYGHWSEAGGLEAAEDLITANLDLNCILGENDQMLFGAMTALENAGITYGVEGAVDIVAAADGAKAAYDLIKEGKYVVTGENSPWLVSAKGFEIAKAILVDGVDPESYPEITLTEAHAVGIEIVDERYDFGF